MFIWKTKKKKKKKQKRKKKMKREKIGLHWFLGVDDRK